MTNFLKNDIGSTQSKKNDTDICSFGVIHLFHERACVPKTDFFRHGGYRFQKTPHIFLAFSSRVQTTTNGFYFTTTNQPIKTR